jgi:hypothetical protein
VGISPMVLSRQSEELLLKMHRDDGVVYKRVLGTKKVPRDLC